MCHSRRVLVVDDTPALKHLLKLALSSEGYTVAVADHGAHALRVLESFTPCLILLDLRMPVMDGIAFARAYRARERADAHIVVMTAEAQPGELGEIAPVQIVRKPFDLDALLPIIDHWVDEHAPTPP